MVFCKSENWTCIYIALKQVSVFLESASRVYEFIWKELSLSVSNTAEGRSWSRLIEISRSRSRMTGFRLHSPGEYNGRRRASKRKSRAHCQSNPYDDCVSAQLTSTRLRFSQPLSVHAAERNRSWKLQRQSHWVSQLNHFDVQVQAYVYYREVKTWHIRVCSWCALDFITDSTYYELVTREDCITAVNRHTAKLPSNKGIMDFTPHKDWVDTILNVENNGALISSDCKPFKIGEAPVRPRSDQML